MSSLLASQEGHPDPGAQAARVAPVSAIRARKTAHKALKRFEQARSSFMQNLRSVDRLIIVGAHDPGDADGEQRHTYTCTYTHTHALQLERRQRRMSLSSRRRPVRRPQRQQPNRRPASSRPIGCWPSPPCSSQRSSERSPSSDSAGPSPPYSPHRGRLARYGMITLTLTHLMTSFVCLQKSVGKADAAHARKQSTRDNIHGRLFCIPARIYYLNANVNANGTW